MRESQLDAAFAALFDTLPISISSTFEHPLLCDLHHSLVIDGDIEQAEAVLVSCYNKGILQEQDAASTLEWTPLSPTYIERAGHQLIKFGRSLICHGGFDGRQDYGDLWIYDLPLIGSALSETMSILQDGLSHAETISFLHEKLEWRLIQDQESSLDRRGGDVRKIPQPRSCHQLAVDESTGWIYLLGGIHTRGGLDTPDTPIRGRLRTA